MKKSGFCRQIIHESIDILLHLNNENFNLINKLKESLNIAIENHVLYENEIAIGDYIAFHKEQERIALFSSNLVPKSFKPSHENKYKLSEDNKKLECEYLSNHIESYFIIENNEQIKVLNFLDNKLDEIKVEIGFYIIKNEWGYNKCVSNEDFQKNYKIVES
ncbi:hypothetical protein GOQ30_11460 [Flavobacterium sp. TP390]|uniref:Uncharacterized protein n=1 Tax=Flavobacterium profundi TaxID=1774945 RepID=A0A6I4ISK7_9FLAO|nr:hypothetical protein [Flavobacterium profundi]MVO09776.1 hypothetical protein [Flavobacterium profundi]